MRQEENQQGMDAEVTVIVPVYNKAVHLRRCLDSILAQTYREIRILLIDDGSTDDSVAICQEYRDLDPRVELLQREHAGVSEARNAGIEWSASSYIQFVDADDMLPPDSTEKLLSAMVQNPAAGLVIGRFEMDGPHEAIGDGLDGLHDRAWFAGKFRQDVRSLYVGVVWNKLYRTDVLNTHRIRFDPEIAWSEDFFFNLDYISSIDFLFCLDASIYCHMERTKRVKYSALPNIRQIDLLRAKRAKQFCVENLAPGETAGKQINEFFFMILYSEFVRIFSGDDSLKNSCHRMLQAIDGMGDLPYVEKCSWFGRNNLALSVFAFFLSHRMYRGLAGYMYIRCKLKKSG